MANTDRNVCKSCPNLQGCHPALQPEKLVWIGLGRTTRLIENHGKNSTTDSHIACRHYTCASDGKSAKDAATRAIKKGKGTPHTVIDCDWQTKVIIAHEFHSGSKFTRRDIARIVDENGRVYSKQDGNFYSTGQ